MLVLLSLSSAHAADPCYPTSVYDAARAGLADLPTARERGGLDPTLANAIVVAENAYAAFLATEGSTSCRTASAARTSLDDAVNAYAAASAGPENFWCVCEDAIPIGGHTCSSCDYHDKWGCQCWFYPNP